MRGRWTGALVALALLVGACGGDPDDAAAPDDAATLDPAPTDGEATGDEATGDDGRSGGVDQEEPVTGDDPEAFARADAAQRAGVDVEEVTVAVHEDVTWPDGALGCPQPDQFYTQALVEGYRIVVEAAGERLHYHGQNGQPPVYCADPSDPVSGDAGVVDR